MNCNIYFFIGTQKGYSQYPNNYSKDIISNILAFVQQVFLTYFYSPKKVIAQQMVDETVVRRSKENNTKRRVDIEKK